MKVLIVEDELSWQEILQEYVAIAVQGVNEIAPDILVAGTFQEAKNYLESGGPWSLLIADITLDESRQSLGKSFGQVLITLASARKIPTIVVSGTISVSTAGNFLRQYGVIDCFSKEDFATFESTFIEDIKKTLLATRSDSSAASNRIAATASINRIEDDLKKGYALLVGIGNYFNITPLRKTVVDAKDMRSVLLSNGYLEKNTCLLLNDQATKASISQALNWLAKSATKDDTVFIFFSGHGLRQIGGFHPGEYLCPVNADLNDLDRTCISSQEFTNALNSIQAGRIAIFLDACHSGGVGDAKHAELVIQTGLSETSYSSFAANDSEGKRGRVIIASCLPSEVSWELSEMTHGLFTHYLLEGLSGEAARLDGKIPIMRLFEYVSDKVPQHRDQHPYIKAASENFIIAVAHPQ